MNISASKKKQPVFGVLSLVLPLFGALLGLAMAHFVRGNGEGWAELTVFCHYSSAGLVLGFISALISLIRLEAYLFLPLIGLVVNVAPFVFVKLF